MPCLIIKPWCSADAMPAQSSGCWFIALPSQSWRKTRDQLVWPFVQLAPRLWKKLGFLPSEKGRRKGCFMEIKMVYRHIYGYRIMIIKSIWCNICDISVEDLEDLQNWSKQSFSPGELAVQIEKEVYKFNKLLGLRSTTFAGGLSKYQQFRTIKGDRRILVGWLMSVLNVQIANCLEFVRIISNVLKSQVGV